MSPDAFSLASTWWIVLPLLCIGVAVIFGEARKDRGATRKKPLYDGKIIDGLPITEARDSE